MIPGMIVDARSFLIFAADVESVEKGLKDGSLTIDEAIECLRIVVKEVRQVVSGTEIH